MQPRNFLRNHFAIRKHKRLKRPLGIEIELLIDHITVVVVVNKCINFALCTRVCSNFDSCAIF